MATLVFSGLCLALLLLFCFLVLGDVGGCCVNSVVVRAMYLCALLNVCFCYLVCWL